MITTLPNAQAAADWLRARQCTHLRSDSRRVREGEGFIAWSGAHVDARDFVIGALDQGAAAALVEAHACSADMSQHWPSEAVAAIDDLKAQAGAIADAFYGQPSRELNVVAITGTNGKTSCAWWLAQALQACDLPCGVIGTLGVGPIDQLSNTGLTTPQAVELHDALAGMREQGLRACAIEASSIGIVEQRLQATQIRVAVFTNLTQDHLDYHGDMARYWAAKQQLFAWPGLQAAVINTDDAHGQPLAKQLAAESPAALDLWTYGTSPQARLQALHIEAQAQGMRFDIHERGQSQGLRVVTPLIGHYNVLNLLAVLGSLRALGIPLAQAVQACAHLSPVPGRLQAVAAKPTQALVLVDYAHTPDAVAQVLGALRPVAQARGGQLWCVLGCGGDRDRAKRAPMAAAAEAHADQVVLTSDNPRSEDPQAILEAMMVGLQQPAHAVCVDRGQAIALAIAHAQPADVVLIAGKGHEDYQEVKGQRLPFSDHDVALAALHQGLSSRSHA